MSKWRQDRNISKQLPYCPTPSFRYTILRCRILPPESRVASLLLAETLPGTLLGLLGDVGVLQRAARIGEDGG